MAEQDNVEAATSISNISKAILQVRLKQEYQIVSIDEDNNNDYSDEKVIHDSDVASVNESSDDEEEESELPSDEDDTETDDEDDDEQAGPDPDDISEEINDEDENETEVDDDDESIMPDVVDAVDAPIANSNVIGNSGNSGNSSSNGINSGIHKRKSKKPERWLQEVKRLQDSTAYLISGDSMRRVVREVAQDFKTDLRFTEESFSAIRTAAEDYLVELFGMANLAAIHRGNITVEPRDMQLILMVSEKFRWMPGSRS